MKTIPCLLVLMLLAACGSQKAVQRSECEKTASMAEYDNCMRRANVGQDDAQKARYR